MEVYAGINEKEKTIKLSTDIDALPSDIYVIKMIELFQVDDLLAYRRDKTREGYFVDVTDII